MLLTMNYASGLTITEMLKNIKTWGTNAGVALVAVVGLAVFVAAIIKIGLNFFSANSQRQPRWGMALGGLIIGGAMMALSGNNFGVFQDIGGGGQNTLSDIAHGKGGAIVQLAPSNSVLSELVEK